VFTGIVEATGRIVGVQPLALEIASSMTGLALGDSVAVNGVCLTVALLRDDSFTADLSEETLRRTNLGRLHVGSIVNLERPMRADGRFGGHIVQGHVDGTSTVIRVERRPGSTEVWFSLPEGLQRYLVEKGSVTVDGVSLTVASLDAQGFSVALIPHTLGVTTLAGLSEGSVVNVEVDVVAKYVQRLMPPVIPAVSAWAWRGSAAAAALGEDPLGSRVAPVVPRAASPAPATSSTSSTGGGPTGSPGSVGPPVSERGEPELRVVEVEPELSGVLREGDL
jgi:riboflavin synthase